MSHLYFLAILLLLTAIGFRMGRSRALTSVGGRPIDLYSLPGYYGVYVAIWCGVPALLLMLVWFAFEPVIVKQLLVASLPLDARDLTPDALSLLIAEARNVAAGIIGGELDPRVRAAADRLTSLESASFAAMMVVCLAAAVGGLGLAWRRIEPHLRARRMVERSVMIFLAACSTIAIFTTLGIVLSLVFEALRFFNAVPVWDFLFGLEWSPQTAIREDQVGSSGSFGAVPLFAGTLLISCIAMAVAAPIGLLSAIYMAEYARPRVRAVVKPLLEILAGVPTVVYGFFAALVIAPFLRDQGTYLGLDVASESALAAGLVMGIMIIPFVSSLSDDVITAVPRSLREGSFGLGATHSETIRLVVLPAALPGVFGGLLLAVSRAIGETMIVVMAAGLSANLTANPLQAVTTVTVQIVTLLVGDQEFDSPKTLAAFALGLVLFCMTLALNVVALQFVRKYREKYD